MLDGSYRPLSRPLFIYVNEASAQRREVRDFVEFYLKQGAALAQEVGFVPLPQGAGELALKHFRDNRLGSVFGGVPEVGVTINELFTRQLTHEPKVADAK